MLEHDLYDKARASMIADVPPFEEGFLDRVHRPLRRRVVGDEAHRRVRDDLALLARDPRLHTRRSAGVERLDRLDVGIEVDVAEAGHEFEAKDVAPHDAAWNTADREACVPCPAVQDRVWQVVVGPQPECPPGVHLGELASPPSLLDGHLAASEPDLVKRLRDRRGLGHQATASAVWMLAL